MDALVDYRVEDSIAVVTMDDGGVNLLSSSMLAELNEALDQAVADRAVVVLTGRPGVFSAGFDLRVLTAGGTSACTMLREGFELAARILAHPTPVVIACSGHALAMGAFLLLSGDFRIGVDGDHRIGANEVAIGLTMPSFGVEICRQRLAPAHVDRAVVNAEIYSPTGALTAGFLDRVVPSSDLRDAALSTARELAKLDMQAHAATKLRLRGEFLKAARAAIEADDAEFRALA